MPMKLNRVVVTGMATITPIGNDLASSWQNLLAGKSGAGPITRFDPAGYDTTFACEVKDFDPTQHIPHKQARRMDYFTQYAVAAGLMAVKDAGLESRIPELMLGITEPDKPGKTNGLRALLASLGIDPSARAEELAVSDFCRLAAALTR